MAEVSDARDVEKLADALLDAVEKGVDDEPGLLDSALGTVRRMAIDFVRRYNRLEIELETTTLTEPVLFVANHGFGGIIDLNVLAVGAVLEELAVDRPVTFLTHQLAWTLGVGPLVEHLGARPASRDSAHEAFAAGHHVVVLPRRRPRCVQVVEGPQPHRLRRTVRIRAPGDRRTGPHRADRDRGSRRVAAGAHRR